MSRIEPKPPSPDGNAVTNSLLARVMGRCPEILGAFGRLDSTIRFHGRLPGELKEAVRRATAAEVGCEYCRSLGAPRTDVDGREALAVAFASAIAQDPSGITDGQFDVLREEFDEEEIVELVAFTCLVAISGQMFGAVMGLEPASAEESAAYQDVLTAKGGASAVKDGASAAKRDASAAKGNEAGGEAKDVQRHSGGGRINSEVDAA